jgi:hypothetical protein
MGIRSDEVGIGKLKGESFEWVLGLHELWMTIEYEDIRVLWANLILLRSFFVLMLQSAPRRKCGVGIIQS